MIPAPLEPTIEEWESIAASCEKHQLEMLLWAHGGKSDDPLSVFDGTVKSLSRLYQTDQNSPFRNLRYRQRVCYSSKLRIIEAERGDVRVKDITFRDIERWYREFAAPVVPGGPKMAPRAYELIKQIRLVFAFGKLVLPEVSGCATVCKIFADMKDAGKRFAGGHRKRKEFLTYLEAKLICEVAHNRSVCSLALAQAVMFECGVRQKDVIGEWVPRSDAGLTDVFCGPSKWLMGMRWEEINVNFIWTHRLSKSVRGQDAIMDAEAGKTEEFALLDFPMVKAELERVAPLDRVNFPAKGPVIINEKTGRPWTSANFGRAWRKLAQAVGIPDNVQNRDSRPGAATEADLAGVPRENVRRLLGHSNEETTAGYQRANREKRSEIAQLRAEKRK